MASSRFSPDHSWRKITFLFLAAAVLTLLFVILTSTISLQNPSLKIGPTDELEQVLESASMGNKTVIIAVVNKAAVEGEVVPNMFDLFLEGFWRGEDTVELLNQLVVVAMDQMAYDRCRFRRLHCYRFFTEEDGEKDLMKEKVYMSKGFINMMWRRTDFLIQVLRKGYNFIFTDIDVLWLRNPFPFLTTNHTDLDVQFSVEFFHGNWSTIGHHVNTGFYYAKSNEKTITLFEKWYDLKDKYPKAKEQDVIQTMVKDGVLNDLGIKARFLEPRYFSNFCHPTSNIRVVITVHATCCRFITAKVADLRKVLHEWVQFRAAPPNATTPTRFSKDTFVECPKSWWRNITHHLNG